MSVTQTLQTWLLAWREAFTCIGLGLRDARHAGLWWRSALWCMAVVALWLGLYGCFGRFFVELSAMLALVSVTGLLGLGVMDGVGTLANGPATLSQMGNIAGSLGSAAKALLSIGQIALALLALAAFFYVMVFIVGAIGTARLPLRWLLLERAKAVAARRYVAWQAPAGLDASTARPAWRRRLLLLLSLLIPVCAMCVLISYLLAWNVQMIYGAAAAEVLSMEQETALRREQRPAILALGLLLCLLMLIPVLNLLLPAVLCSSVCHLQRRGWRATGTSIQVE
ncbi:hypothetical protein [Janthinobacterium sp. PAMC25594]|uniref:hypothetical protein n=1 Tax=Janthinobacterium sp. PAMC25594 TaxID=2861284 RepID=UPI001C63B156|nr:hypothetical protein [Janthinobacterium sp. PAMC25594]QYG09270.1 hypothetical protein KY494_11380 [Janthinobacterium sp. PAMC25594]